jgi:hypothetical protein
MSTRSDYIKCTLIDSINVKNAILSNERLLEAISKVACACIDALEGGQSHSACRQWW